jgi:hypothetical protein
MAMEAPAFMMAMVGVRAVVAAAVVCRTNPVTNLGPEAVRALKGAVVTVVQAV